LIREITERRPEIVLTVATPTTFAMRDAAADIPIVFIQVSDPVGTGLVASLSRPGGNITGFTNFEFSMAGKWLELLKEMVPNVKRAAFLFNPATAPAAGKFYFHPILAGSSALEIAVSEMPVANSDDLERQVQQIANDRSIGLIVGPDIFTATHRNRIVALASQYRLPAVYAFRYFATAGGLLSYGSDTIDLYRRAAGYVDRILKGAKPADLPVQQPTKFELVINLKTAKALGLDVPDKLLAIADEVIE
jgi:putative ABC transport system substrate-binding protein